MDGQDGHIISTAAGRQPMHMGLCQAASGTQAGAAYYYPSTQQSSTAVKIIVG